MDLHLRGLNAILVGGAKGIGLATAEILADEGCNIAVCGRDEASVGSAVANLSGRSVKAIGGRVDVANPQAYAEWIAETADRLGGCDIFISFVTAGGGPASEESWRAAVESDLLGTVRGVDAVLPSLRLSTAPAIVALGSTAAVEAFGGVQPYSAIKTALIAYASALSQELAPAGIRVNTVSPGPVFLPGGTWDHIRSTMPEFYDATLAAMPIQRFVTAAEVARTIAFVASPACRAMTGANIVVDGGFTKRHQF